MKYNPFIFSFFALIILCSLVVANNNYTINGDTVFIDDSNVYLSATPHTLSCSEWVYFNLTSKVYTGNIDACWGFNTSVSKPTKAEIYSPHWINTTTNHQKIFYNPTHVVYTGDDLKYGNSYNTNYRYTITESTVNENGTRYIMSNASFDSYITDGTNYTIYWYTRHDNYYLWKDFSSSFNSVIHDYKGYNKWYYIKNVPITSNKEYTVRAWIDVPISTEKQFGKYYFAIKPSHETISQAITNGHFYNLDPWWNATWSNRKNITLTGNTSGAQTNYQLLLNVTYDSDMQSDFDDLRFCNETYELDSWLESKVDGSYALVWVKFPTTPADTIEQTYYMYYGNVGAASNWDGAATFIKYDGFEDGDTTDASDLFVTVSNYASSIQAHVGTYSAKFSSASPSLAISQSIGSLAFDSAIIMDWIYISSISGRIYTGGITDSSGTTSMNTCGPACKFDGGTIYNYNGTAWVNTGVTYTAGAWHKIEIRWKSASKFDLRLDDGSWVSDLDTYKDDSINIDKLMESVSVSSGNEYTDDYCIRKYVTNPPTYAFGSEETVPYTPPNPITLINTTGNFWVNHTWSAGSGNVTDSYNVSVNNIWYNTTINTFYNDTYTAHAWQNITVYAFNTSDMGTLSTGSISQNTQIPNNPITITNTSDWSGDAGETVYVDYDATDIDSDTATFSCDRTDLFTDFDTSTGTGNWTATANIYYVDFGVSDGYGSISNYTMTLIESSVEITLLDELKLIMSEMTSGLKSINMGDYLVYAFILIGILLIILGIQIITNNIYRG